MYKFRDLYQPRLHKLSKSLCPLSTVHLDPKQFYHSIFSLTYKSRYSSTSIESSFEASVPSESSC